MKLVDDAREVWRHWSTQALAASAGIPTVWASIPDDMKAAWPPSTIHWVLRVTGIIAGFGLVGKYIKQKPCDPPKDAP